MRTSKLMIFDEEEQRAKDLWKYWEFFEEEVMSAFTPGDDPYDGIFDRVGQHKNIIMLEMPEGITLVFYGSVYELDQAMAPMAELYAEHLRMIDTAKDTEIDNEIMDALETVSK